MKLKVIYLFAGKQRRSDIGSFLSEYERSGVILLDIREFDIERSSQHDLTKDELWEEIFATLKEGDWILIVSPPCNTFSRARFQFLRSPGPRPLRNFQWPRGFPWLAVDKRRVVEEANHFIDQCVVACVICFQHHGHYLWEHPEDLGEVLGEHPGSIWQWPSIRDLAVQSSAFTFAIQQCHFGAETPKPTRFLTTLETDDPRCWFKWPTFSADHKYLGPLPRDCGHFHKKKLIGRTSAGWNTSPSAAYPAGLCEFLATLILSSRCSVGRGASSAVAKSDNASLGAPSLKSLKDNATLSCSDVTAKGNSTLSEGNSTLSGPDDATLISGNAASNGVTTTLDECPTVEAVGADNEENFDMAACKNHGRPISVEWDAKTRFFIDGFGLCSPTRWQPWDRGLGRTTEAKALLTSIYSSLFREVVSSIDDARRTCFELVLGRLKVSPFSAELVGRCREAIGASLGLAGVSLEVPEGQPFHLHLVARVLKAVGDPDASVLVDGENTFAAGVPVGVDEPLPRTPMVFPPKEKHRKLDESDFNPIAENYSSAQLSKTELEAKFREEEALGRMFPSKLSVLKAEYGDRLRVASMAAITKPDGGIRPLHDGTHSVRVNNDIIYRDRIQCPGPPEVAAIVRECSESGEAPFAVAADIKSAHRLVKVKREDWGYMCCRSDSASDVVWCNKVGTFGISSAPYWWARLFSLIGRFVSYILGNELFYHMVYVDDLNGAFLGERKFVNLLVWILAFEVAGTPFGYHKFSGGITVSFVGYQLQYDSCQVGISDRRGRWLVDWIDKAQSDSFVVVSRDFAEFLGRLGFVSQVLVWLKPHLSPLYAWSAATASGTVGKLPQTVILTMLYLRRQLAEVSFMVSAKRPIYLSSEVFRTDAKCEDGRVVLAGWEVSDDPMKARWFRVELSPQMAPYLFKDGKSQWASTSAELLASYVALFAFGLVDGTRSRKVIPFSIPAGTDNRANEFLTVKRSTTKWPLMIINLQLSHVLASSALTLNLQWRPREENTLADALTNADDSAFDSTLRVNVLFKDIPMVIVNELWQTKLEFDHRKSSFIAGEVSRRKRQKTQW